MEPNDPKKTPDTEMEPKTNKPDTGVKNIEEREIEETGSREDDKRENDGYVDFSKLF